MMAGMGNKWIALCSAAVSVIYTAGYIVTDSGNADASPSPGTVAIAQPAPQPSVQAESFRRSDRQGGENRNPSPEGKMRPDERQEPPQGNRDGRAPNNSTSTHPGDSGAGAGAVTGKPPAPTGKAAYKDGVFEGSGTNRFGTVDVAVTVKSGSISGVQITSSRTRYPQKYIDPLPAQVVAKQTYQIDAVSGATYSSEDFMNAVYQALLQAEKS